MNIDIGDYVTLNDNKRYFVSSMVVYNNNLYYMLNDFKDMNEFKIFMLVNNNKLIKIDDESIISRLVPYFVRESLNSIEN